MIVTAVSVRPDEPCLTDSVGGVFMVSLTPLPPIILLSPSCGVLWTLPNVLLRVSWSALIICWTESLRWQLGYALVYKDSRMLFLFVFCLFVAICVWFGSLNMLNPKSLKHCLGLGCEAHLSTCRLHKTIRGKTSLGTACSTSSSCCLSGLSPSVVIAFFSLYSSPMFSCCKFFYCMEVSETTKVLMVIFSLF